MLDEGYNRCQRIIEDKGGSQTMSFEDIPNKNSIFVVMPSNSMIHAHSPFQFGYEEESTKYIPHPLSLKKTAAHCLKITQNVAFKF